MTVNELIIKLNLVKDKEKDVIFTMFWEDDHEDFLITNVSENEFEVTLDKQTYER